MNTAMSMLVVAMAMGGGCGSVLRMCRCLVFMGFFAGINFSQSQFAEEGHEP